ncbi:hypothetical protein MUK42_36560 [Musa troglodytarum]|uniref:Uncharacterized protein n=1 Tax=Musa troglodytarum TaxID=320322 RepID=A0A9E7FQJ1_9LILI|nr:hypothetical protein MUK42_36560 [Musa troglodytarum]
MSGPQICYCITPWVDCKQKYDKHVILAQLDRCDAAICIARASSLRCVTSLYDQPLELFLMGVGFSEEHGRGGWRSEPM